ncbi:hypothetical protein NLU13_0076 [Sarocladium strictum]|uniref:Zn(2)-C6 fungal-type domain-containing protein n=1 Tax=Sarocladium strictum TaxID=5046 RepID=A0AA39LAY1_SARSR|nr:hypothetical protein NLU13_0076 [Sarocladium strictum]
MASPRERQQSTASSEHGRGEPMDVGSESPGETPSAATANQASTGNTPQPTSANHSGAASHGNPTPGSTGSAGAGQGARAAAAASAASASASNSHISAKRRRGLGVVTPNACTECRKKRAKCDGNKPCGRCRSQKDVECVYEVPIRQSKEHLRNEIETLRARQRTSEQVINALTRPDLWEEVLSRLRNGQTVETISDWLGGTLPPHGGQLPPFQQLHGDPSARTGTSGPTLAPISSFMSAESRSIAPSGPQLAPLNLGGMGGGMSPTIPQQGGGLRTEMGHNSPWNLSSHSQPGSNRSNSYTDAMNWQIDIPGPPQFRVGSWASESTQPDHMKERMPRFRGLEHILSPLNEPELKSPAGSWTNITSDINLVLHLLALYFCWEYPTFASLSKEHFLRDFQDGRHRYCSPILVNALLALGCRFSTQPMTRANPNDPYTSGDHFFKESQRLFYQENDHHSLTTIQALGIMSIREASCGRDSESWYYAGQSVRLAIEMGLHRLHDRGDEDELAVQAATFWGAFALDHAWSLATGSLPQCSCFPHLPPKPAIISDIEASLWVPYTDDGAPLQRSCSQPSNVRSVYKCFCELSELVHESLYILHSPGKPLTARDLLKIYTQYLNWYDRIPEVLRLGHNFTPAVLFAHMYYHFAILLLFRPLIKLRILGSKISPKDVCSQAADAIQGLLKSYSQLYTLQRTPSFVPYFVLTSSIMHLAIGASEQGGASATSTPEERIEKAAKLDPRIKESLTQGIADLAEMAPCHHFAEQALNILRYLAKKWNIEVEIDHGKSPPPQQDYDSLVKPYTASLNFFAPNVSSGDFDCVWGFGDDETGTTTTSRSVSVGPKDSSSGSGRQGKIISTAAESLENPLFWPFPMQGRPILPSGKELKTAGFAVL